MNALSCPAATMPITVASDLHFECLNSHARAMLLAELNASAPPDGSGVLVLAGDVATVDVLPGIVTGLAPHWRAILHVAGNHECYGSTFQQALHARSNLGVSNFRTLHRSAVTLDGVRFVGATGWYDRTPRAQAVEHLLNDRRAIKDFHSWIDAESEADAAWLDRTVQPGDVAITHYLPSYRSVHARYAGCETNLLFVRDREALIARAKPQLWIHGHTHVACDYQLGATRVVCNPSGYPSECATGYRRGLVVHAKGRELK